MVVPLTVPQTALRCPYPALAATTEMATAMAVAVAVAVAMAVAVAVATAIL